MSPGRIFLPLLVVAAVGAALWLALSHEEAVSTSNESFRAELPEVNASPLTAADDSAANDGPGLASAPGRRPRGTQGTSSIRGRVWRDGNVPAAGAKITAALDATLQRVVAQTVAFEDGSYSLAGLAERLYWIEAELADSDRRVVGGGLVRAGVADFDFVVVAQPRRVAVVVHGPDGALVPSVQLRGISGPTVRDLARTANGTAWIQITSEAWSAGLPSLEGAFVEAYDARDAAGQALPLAPARVGPLAADVARIELRMEAGAFVEARIHGLHAARLALGTWQLTPASHEEASGPPSTGRFPELRVSGDVPEDGHIRVAAIDPGREHELRLYLPSGLRVPKRVRLLPGAPVTDVAMLAAFEVTIRVQGPDGQPVPWPEVTAWTGERKTDPVHGRVPIDGAPGVVILNGLDPEQPCVLRIRDRASAEPHDTSNPHDPGPDVLPYERKGWMPRDETIRLERAGTLAGTVVYESGQPVPGAQVRMAVSDGDGDPATAERRTATQMCDEMGRFAFRGLEHGRYVLLARLADPMDADAATSLPMTTRVESGRKDVTLVLPGTRTVLLEVPPGVDLSSPSPFGNLLVRRWDGAQWRILGRHDRPIVEHGIHATGLGDAATYDFIHGTEKPGYARAIVEPGATRARFRQETGGEIWCRVSNPREADELEVACVVPEIWDSGVAVKRTGLGVYVMRGLLDTEHQVVASGRTLEGRRLSAHASARPGDLVTLTLETEEDPLR
jgi:hypothetical protein